MTRRLGYQHRQVPMHQFRALDNPNQFQAVVLRYNVLDDYETMFEPGVFDASMDTRMPRVVWSHDWSEPLGRYISYVSTSKELTLTGEFDDFTKVPRAAQAHEQLRSGTIDQFSVGFLPQEFAERQVPIGLESEQTKSVLAFTKGRLDEVSLVLVGAVPGTELLSVRIGQHPGRPHIFLRGSTVDVDVAAGILLDLQGGKVDIADALMALKQSAVPETQPDGAGAGAANSTEPPPGKAAETPPDVQEDTPGDDVGEPVDDGLDAEIAAALEMVDHG